MPGTIRMSARELLDLIEATEETGGDASELRTFLDQVGEGKEHKARPSREPSLNNEEPTAQERLEFEAGYLFPAGVTDEIMSELIEFDLNHSLSELKNMCVKTGLSPSGHKKLLAAKLLAHRRRSYGKRESRFEATKPMGS